MPKSHDTFEHSWHYFFQHMFANEIDMRIYVDRDNNRYLSFSGRPPDRRRPMSKVVIVIQLKCFIGHAFLPQTIPNISPQNIFISLPLLLPPKVASHDIGF